MFTNSLIDIVSYKPTQLLTKYNRKICVLKSKNILVYLQKLIPIGNISSTSHHKGVPQKTNENKIINPDFGLQFEKLKFNVSIFILITLILCGLNLPMFSQQVKFQHLTMENGLSNNKVFTVIQDRIGFIWFGTNDGLNRYDGYNFKVFRNNPNDSNSISDNSIEALLEDREGNIWIGTKDGVLNKYNPITEEFTHWKLKLVSPGYNTIKYIYEDSKRNIWVGTLTGGLYRLNYKKNIIDHWIANPDKINSLSNNYVTSIVEDNIGNIIVGTYNGLNIFKPDKPQNGFKTFYYEVDNINSLSSNIIWMVSKSSIDSNIIWIGAIKGVIKFNSINSTFKRIEITNPDNLLFGTSCNYVIEEIIDGEEILWIDSYGGLVKLNLTLNKTDRFFHNENNSQSLIHNQINKIFKDRTGVIWVATESGVSYITPKSTLFNSFNLGNDAKHIALQLNKKNITAISKFNDNRTWIATTDGLYLLTNINNNSQIRKISKFDGYYIWSLISTKMNEVWVGTYGKGLKQFNYIKNKITDWDLNKTNFLGQSIYFNKAVLEDSEKNIWIGYWGVGVVRLNPRTGNYTRWLNNPENPKSLSFDGVWVIEEDRLGRIWIGTKAGGLNLFEDRDGGIFHHWLQTKKNRNELSSNRIFSLCAAKKNIGSDNSKTILWIGSSNGLNKFIIKNNKPNSDIYDIDVKINFYTVDDGLSDNYINSIVEDEKGNLWLGTNSGISFFDVSKEIFSNFSTEDGINGTMMNHKSALNLNNGLILFGSTKGLNILEPAKIKPSSYKPNLVITDFQIFNKSVKVGNNSPLKQSIQTTDKIKLAYNQNVFSFEFAALDYNSPQTIQYAYMIEGFDKDWIISKKRRYVTYTNLDPDEYTFKIKSTNADGIWDNKGKSVLIRIEPPYWKTWWAYISYALVFILGFYSFRKYETNKRRKKVEDILSAVVEREKLKQSELKVKAAEYKTKVVESEKETEKQQIRNRISTDLHDEIGSNLSSIILLSSLVNKKQKVDEELKKYLTEIHGAAKISAEAIRDIVWLVNPTSDQTNKLASKMVETANAMLGDIKHESKKSNFDTTEKLPPDVKRNIFLIYKEILTNIIKHSQASFVKINIIEENDTFKFSVEDNGVGFDIHRKNGGNGLRNLKYRTQQIDGNLQISSEEKKGTVITFIYNMA